MRGRVTRVRLDQTSRRVQYREDRLCVEVRARSDDTRAPPAPSAALRAPTPRPWPARRSSPTPRPRASRRSSAPQLAAALQRHAASRESDFPLLHVRGDDGYELAPGVVEYLLDLFRELDAAGCFAQVPR